MQVKEVMTPNVERVPPDTPVREAATKMRDLDVGAIPVYEGDKLIGMVTDRDIAIRACAGDGAVERLSVREIMSPGISYCFEDEDIRQAGKQMREKEVRRLVVLDRGKRLVGIVSLGDLAAQGSEKVAAKTLEGVTQIGRPPSRRASGPRSSEKQARTARGQEQ